MNYICEISVWQENRWIKLVRIAVHVAILIMLFFKSHITKADTSLQICFLFCFVFAKDANEYWLKSYLGTQDRDYISI